MDEYKRLVNAVVEYLKPSLVAQQPWIDHHPNCICNLKTWGTEDQCDCGLKELRLAIVPFLGTECESKFGIVPSKRWDEIIDLCEGK